MTARAHAPHVALPAFLLTHVNDPHGDTDPCVLWPFGIDGNGYGCLKVKGRMRGAHNYALELREGPPPEDQPYALHGPCHNPLCIIHTHWGTKAENSADTLRDGTHQRGQRGSRAKLTLEQVEEIRRRRALGETKASIARDYPVGEQTVGKILNGRRWQWLDV